MPIHTDNRKCYDARWRKFRLHDARGGRQRLPALRKTHRLLNVAHITHHLTDQHFLAVLCPSCYAKNDSPAHRHDPPNPAATPRAVLVERGNPRRPLPRPDVADSVGAKECDTSLACTSRTRTSKHQFLTCFMTSIRSTTSIYQMRRGMSPGL
jgi:hypothetical protein